MTTDKVRVEIKQEFYTDTDSSFIAKVYCQSHYIECAISKDRDNWIDITLPEEINGCTKFSCYIYYRVDKSEWRADLYPLDEQGKLTVGKFYELPVTVY
jgi:hypothetical protein